MDDIVKASIDARKNSLFQLYEIDDEKFCEKVDKIFAEMAELGEDCKNSQEFEARLAASPLNDKYVALFTDASRRFKSKYDGGSAKVLSKKDIAKDVAASVLDSARIYAESAVQPLTHEAHYEAKQKMRDMPVVGEVMQAKNIADAVSKYKGIFKKFKK